MKLEDGATRIFINTRGTNRQEFSQEFLDFMEYITATTDEIADGTKSPRIKLIHEKVRKIKISEKMGVKFMQKWEEIAYARDEGRSEGLVQGQAKGEKLKLIEMTCKKLRKGKTPEEISEDLEEDMEVILRICNAANEYAPDYDAEKVYSKLYE